MLCALVARVAESGRLRVSVPHAARLIHAGACGATLSLIAAAPAQRDARLSGSMREAVFAAILTPAVDDPAPGPSRLAGRAVALRAVLSEGRELLSPAEQQLLGEWLDRLATLADSHGKP